MMRRATFVEQRSRAGRKENKEGREKEGRKKDTGVYVRLVLDTGWVIRWKLSDGRFGEDWSARELLVD